MSTITKRWKKGFAPADQLGSDFPALLLVRSSRWIRLLARVTLIALVLSVIAMLLLPWQQTSRGEGIVTALNPQQRPQQVQSQYDGIVKRIAPGLLEGSRVKKGDFILELEPTSRGEIGQTDLILELLQEQLRAEQAELELYQTQVTLSETSRTATEEKQKLAIESARFKLQEKESLIRKYRVDLGLAKLNRERSDELKVVGVEPGLDNATYRAKENALEEELSAQLQSQSGIQTDIKEKEAELSKIIAEMDDKVASSKSKVQSQIGKIQATQQKISDVKIKRGNLDRLEQTAPCDGVLYRLVTAEGTQSVKKGDELFTIVPDVESLSVELTIAGNDTSFVREGQEVRLQFEGWPAVQFIGWPSVAIGTFGGRVRIIDKFSEGAGKFRILVVPDPDQEPWPDERFLRQGMRANGWVMLNQVSLGFEIWRQLNGFPPSLEDIMKSSEGDSKKPKIKLPK
jgi:multidrug resistance efflux pump